MWRVQLKIFADQEILYSLHMFALEQLLTFTVTYLTFLLLVCVCDACTFFGSTALDNRQLNTQSPLRRTIFGVRTIVWGKSHLLTPLNIQMSALFYKHQVMKVNLHDPCDPWWDTNVMQSMKRTPFGKYTSFCTIQSPILF